MSRAEDRRILGRSIAKYLVGSDGVDDGSLRLFWDRIEFSGWRGKCRINLKEISSTEAGVSHLPALYGVPIVERLWPGPVRMRQTLLMHLLNEGGNKEQAVLAGLPFEKHLPELVETTRSAYSSAVETRAKRTTDIYSATERRLAAEREIVALQRRLQSLEGEIKTWESNRDDAERELQLPDWEHRTLQLRGRNLNQQLERELRAASAAGWELVSTASPRKDEIVATLKRVRRV
jgi:hypothetical protein